MDTKKEFTIATYNILFGINQPAIIKNIVQMAEDGVSLFCLQEIINVPNEEFIIDKILKRLGTNWKASYHVGREMSKLSIGTAILWNTKIFNFKRQEKILLPKLDKFDLHEKLYYKVIGVPGVPLQRKVLSCYFTVNQTDIRITCVHVDNVGGPSHRMKQIAYLLSNLNSQETPKHEIICGDFNTFDLLKSGYEKKLLQNKFGKDFIDASNNIGWTSDIRNIDFKTSIKIFQWFIKTFNVHVRRRLDYIWVKNFSVEKCKKLLISGSDHYPIIAKLKF